MSVEWSGKLELIKRLYQFQKLMPHINYFRASLFLFLSSFDTQFELYLLHKCINYMLFVRVALIVICSIVFYRMFIFYKVLFVRNDIIHTHCFMLPKCDQNTKEIKILLKELKYTMEMYHLQNQMLVLCLFNYVSFKEPKYIS